MKKESENRVRLMKIIKATRMLEFERKNLNWIVKPIRTEDTTIRVKRCELCLKRGHRKTQLAKGLSIYLAHYISKTYNDEYIEKDKERKKKSSATMLRNKLNQVSLSREFESI